MSPYRIAGALDKASSPELYRDPWWFQHLDKGDRICTVGLYFVGVGLFLDVLLLLYSFWLPS